MATGFCVKCQANVNMISPVEKVNKRGLKYVQGKCPDCDCKVNRIIGK